MWGTVCIYLEMGAGLIWTLNYPIRRSQSLFRKESQEHPVPVGYNTQATAVNILHAVSVYQWPHKNKRKHGTQLPNCYLAR